MRWMDEAKAGKIKSKLNGGAGGLSRKAYCAIDNDVVELLRQNFIPQDLNLPMNAKTQSSSMDKIVSDQ
jgi:hypothetical protein